MSPQVFLIGVGVVILGVNMLVHLYYRESESEAEREVSGRTFCEIIGEYRVFFNIKTGYCRLAIFLMLYSQGLRFFSAGYQYELIRSGFSK